MGDGIEELHQSVDHDAGKLARRHAGRLQCARGCAQCCVDGLTVFQVEADRIQRNCREVLEDEEPHPPGKCAFLGSEQECRIYQHRPYVCRTQGLPLRWLEEGPSGESIELRDICPLNEDGPPIEELPAEHCWTIGPVEQRLTQLQSGRASMSRVALRSLFRVSRQDAKSAKRGEK